MQTSMYGMQARRLHWAWTMQMWFGLFWTCLWYQYVLVCVKFNQILMMSNPSNWSIDIFLGCTAGFWGRNCSHKCDCEHDSICDQFNGMCKCTKGYTGDRCESECPSDRYGMNCSERCRCKNGGKCHHISGECTCAPGYTGPLCNDLCPVGTHGEACKSKCKCQNDGLCNPQTGTCECPPGWTGEVKSLILINHPTDLLWKHFQSINSNRNNGIELRHLTFDQFEFCFCSDKYSVAYSHSIAILVETNATPVENEFDLYF